MHKLLASIRKEYLLLSRDVGGLLILFLMPVLLVITITLVQESTFKSVTGSTVEVLLVDQDHGSISGAIKRHLKDISFLQPVSNLNGEPISEQQASEWVAQGKYQLAIVVPQGVSQQLKTEINANVQKIMSGSSSKIFSTAGDIIPPEGQKTIKIYFDPATQQSFRSSVQFVIEKMINQLETQFLYAAFEKKLGNAGDFSAIGSRSFIRFEKINPSLDGNEILPNAVQHNVPAWTLFAIFFLVLPLSLNMVKEKNQGTFVRLQSSPVKYFTLVSGKAVLYLLVCILQMLIILGIGIFIFPHIGLPELHLQGNLPLLLVVTLFSGLAAIGLGILLGTIFSTQEQAAPFAAILVILLAAIGGVWVPTFAMPALMRQIASGSPMNWGLEAYYVLFLRNGSFEEILPYLLFLLLFFVGTLVVALLINAKKNEI